MKFSIFAAVFSSCNGYRGSWLPLYPPSIAKVNHLHMDSLIKICNVYLFSSLVLNFISSTPTISLCCEPIAHWGITHRPVFPEQKKWCCSFLLERPLCPSKGRICALIPAALLDSLSFRQGEQNSERAKIMVWSCMGVTPVGHFCREVEKDWGLGCQIH